MEIQEVKSQEVAIQEIEDLIDEFSYIDTPIEKMKFIIDLGKDMGDLEEVKELVMQEKFKIPGCVSLAYLRVEKIGIEKITIEEKEERLQLSYYADSGIIQGFLALICEILQDTSERYLKENIEHIKRFAQHVELEHFLSPNRSNALYSIFKKLEEYCE